MRILLTIICFQLVGLTGSLAQSTTPTRVKYKLQKNIFYRDLNTSDDYMKNRCKLDIYHPKNIENYPTVVWFHGGGIKAGSKYIPDELRSKGMAVVAVNYRLHPKVKNPAYIEDAAAAVAWVYKNIEKYGGSKDLIFVSGHSAGGYLASMVGLDKRWLAAFNVDANKLAGLLPYSGHTITHFTIRAERSIKGTRPIVDEYAPLYHVREDAPPYIIITGDRELELLGRYEENAYMMRMMKVVGHDATEIYELDGYNHGEMPVPAHHILINKVKEITKKIKGEAINK